MNVLKAFRFKFVLKSIKNENKKQKKLKGFETRLDPSERSSKANQRGHDSSGERERRPRQVQDAEANSPRQHQKTN
jgi:hypothetical protein